MKNFTDHIPISNTVIEMCKTKFEKEDRTAYTDKQVLEFMKSDRMVGKQKEYWKDRNADRDRRSSHRRHPRR